jgi:hypothetical protein
MSYPIKIGGREITLAWTQEVARRFRYRVGIIGGLPEPNEYSDESRAESAYARILWCLLPAKEHARHKSPEDLFAMLEDDEIPAIVEAVVGVFEDMTIDAEKKSTLKSLPSHESS